jgi:hypothetical protein
MAKIMPAAGKSQFKLMFFNPPTFCRNPADNTQYRIELTGRSVRIQGFGFPESGRLLTFADTFGAGLSVPLVPHDSASSTPLGELFAVAADGTWRCRTPYFDCSDAPSPVTVVVWFRYVNATSNHICLDALELTPPDCATVANLGDCNPP